MTYPVFIFYEMRIFFCFCFCFCLTLKRNIKTNSIMKTKLNKKSLAAAIAAIVLSTGAFLGISLSLSQKADAQMLPCWLALDDEVIMACDYQLIYTCEVEIPCTITDPETGKEINKTMLFHCSGKNKIEDSGGWLIENPIARP